MTVARGMWVWVREDAPPDPAEVAAIAEREHVAEAFVSVPWSGPSADTHRIVAALRGRGVRVSALGGDPAWTTGGDAVAWMQRATAAFLFEGVHLDIEPWGRRDWTGREAELLRGLERTVRDVAARTSLPVDVDLVPWLAEAHPRQFADIAERADAVTLMAYRDRAADILATSAAARSALGRLGRSYRVGVETGPIAEPEPTARQTFADDGRAVLERELAEVAAALAADARCTGLALHDLAGCRVLGP